MVNVLLACLIGGLLGCFVAVLSLHYTGIFLHDSKEKFEEIAQKALDRVALEQKLEQELKEKEELEKLEKEMKKRRTIYDPHDPSW